MFNNAHGGVNMVISILRLPRILQDTGRSRSSLYRDIDEGLFPKPVAIGLRAVGWPEHEVQAINSARIAGKNRADIKALVLNLEAARKGGL
jgi:prophage regulatory protein